MNVSTVVETCNILNITGRNFNINYDSFTIKEGPTEALMKYYDAMLRDPWIELSVLHQQSVIKTRNFDNFSVWVRSSRRFDLGPV